MISMKSTALGAALRQKLTITLFLQAKKEKFFKQ